MFHFRFILEPYISQKNRYQCPSCGKNSVFTRYVDQEKKEYVAENVGKCNREQKCGYHLSPKEYFDNQITLQGNQVDTDWAGAKKPLIDFCKPKKTNLASSFIESRHLLNSLKHNSDNNFLLFLEKMTNKETVSHVKEKYKIGTSKKWKGATIFWQIDNRGKIRTGKMMLYNKVTGKKNKINWVHSVLRLDDFNLNQCLFGLHLLNSDKNKAIALVESEKTAVIASIAFPQFIWMATGGLMNLKKDMILPLANRKVILYPDAGCYDIWSKKVADLPKNIQFIFSDLLERKATAEEKTEGWDIADYVLGVWGDKV
ncbi:DUF6371 domain-containing protein [Planktosalinus lacus]|uniref:Uncharacterized protein n=1 Tax=Planktosalinus lacus TaxID=1526573 RepID=A0A8J2VB07_9FLAO|nr:DUF6371 domain-containing protein [Planktosalinus lacus]GGD99602.1 hypothetical protein GCM10011312_23840 [Planktosalinus lacus]